MTKAKPKLFGTLQDQARLLEGRYDVKAAQSPEQIAHTQAGQALLTESAADLSDHHQALRGALLAQARDLGETDAARAAAQAAIRDAVATYSFVRRKIKDALLNLPPDQARTTSAEEITLRARAIERVLGRHTGKINNQGVERQVTLLTELAQAIAQDPILSAPGAHKGLEDAIARADAAQKDLSREQREDTDAMRALTTARDAFDRAASAHALLVRALLTRQGRESELGRFIKAQDPAYAARRRAQQPIEDEPDADLARADDPNTPTADPSQTPKP